MVVMDVFTRRVIGFGVEPADIDGHSVCRMFNKAKSDMGLPITIRCLTSTDGEPICACLI